MFQFHREILGVHPHMIFEIAGFKITDSTLFSVLITIIFGIICVAAYRTYKIRPGKIQAGFESILEAIEGLLTQITGSKKTAAYLLPTLATVFLYIATANLLGMVPGILSFKYDHMHMFRPSTSDFNTTFGLAFATLIALQIVAIKDFGVWKYINKYIKVEEVVHGFKKSIADGFIALIDFAIGFLDIVGELARVVSMSLRLFGNIYAGEVLATLILGAFALVLPVTWTAMSILVGVVQAIVFTSLITSYYMLAAKGEGDDASHGNHHELSATAEPAK